MLVIKDDKYKGLEKLVEFLNKQRDEEFEWYKKEKEEYLRTLEIYRQCEIKYGVLCSVSPNGVDSNGKTSREITNDWDDNGFLDLHNDLYGSNGYWEKRGITSYERKLIMLYPINKISFQLDLDYESTFNQLIQRVEKKGGEVEEVLSCSLGVDGSVNGVIKCKDKVIEIDTIIAGGEVQRAHYRVLVKVFKEKKSKK